MKKSILISAIAFLFLSGCFVAPPQEAVKRAPGPYPAGYKTMITGYLNVHLVDPDSIKDFTVIKPPEKTKLDTGYPFIPLYKGQFVWECFIAYDAKNEKGVYVGSDMHVVWIRFNRVVAFDYKDTELDYRVKERIENPGY
ncbi:MAG: hypothetical protein GXP53_10700 [Deltaproteobacteria bacterium]|nr:hypothetical protein [Deltaproteobacteria bacterium]